MSHIEQALRNAGAEASVPATGSARVASLDAYPALAHAEPAAQKRPFAEPQPNVSSALTDFSDRLIVHEQVPRVCTEQFRALAAALHQKQGERGLKTVMIASAHAQEGKTFTAANLGLMLSESYRRRVLVIDADLRRPSLHEVFNISNADGLSEGLREHARQAARVTQISEWLAVLPGGTPEADPMPSLTSGRLQSIIQEAASRFDWVILDTPPVALLPDARLMASMVEAAVLVVGAGATPYHLVHRTVEAIGRNKIVGVVLNRIDRSALPEASYEHYYGQKRTAPPRKRFFGCGGVPERQ